MKKLIVSTLFLITAVNTYGQWSPAGNTNFLSHSHSTSHSDFGLDLENSAGGFEYMIENNTTGVNRQAFYFGHANSTKNIFGISSSSNSGSSWQPRLVITQNGNIGIGTNTPGYKMDVKGDVYFTTATLDNLERELVNNSDGELYFDQNFSNDYPDIFSNGGGLSIKTEDGWGAIIATNNMEWIRPRFDGGIFKSQVIIGGSSTSGNYALQLWQNTDDRFGGVRVKNNTNGQSSFIWMDASNKLRVDNSSTAGRDVIFNGDGTGKVGIGTTNPDQELTVKGTIHAEEVLVDLNVPGPDYVFEEDYPLQDLSSLEQYLKTNKHLPEVPSASEMEKEGIKVGEMEMLLLKKVEELTLHIIRQEKEIEKLKERLDDK